MTRQEFLLAVPEALLAAPLLAETRRPKLLIVAAHPDDEYAFAATTYRLTRELGWTADHVVITNGEAGYRYSALAEAIYGVDLTDEGHGRSQRAFGGGLRRGGETQPSHGGGDRFAFTGDRGD